MRFRQSLKLLPDLRGAGGDESGAARGGLSKVFGMRTVVEKVTSPGRRIASKSAVERRYAFEQDRKSYLVEGGRLRSQSAGSSGKLLTRQSTNLDGMAVDAFGAMPCTSRWQRCAKLLYPNNTRRDQHVFIPALGCSTKRPRTSEKSEVVWASGDWTNRRSSHHESPPADPDAIEPFEGPSISGRNSPSQQQTLDGAPLELNRSKADYTTREVDFYYGIKTGPTDPTGIPASAVGWFKGLFKGKTKEKGKGFEVGFLFATGAIRHGPIDSDSEDEVEVAGPSGQAGPSHVDGAASDDDGELVSPMGSDDGHSYHDEDEFEMTRISDLPPSLQGLNIPEGGMELPSRFPSKASSRIPHVPRKSSRRKSQNTSVDFSIPGSSHHTPQNSLTSRLPFERSNSNKRHSDTSARSSIAGQEGYGHSRNTSFGNFTEAYGNERPTSVGYVSQHHIHTINPPENNPEYLGSSAELVDGRISEVRLLTILVERRLLTHTFIFFTLLIYATGRYMNEFPWSKKVSWCFTGLCVL
ncbi:hypothetical protein EYC84_006417 [Monilinia fructicola]|uniref:Uncharacterized protein n=1 Tax=Monilinia fructicola TaxID=38448 RepID=A0A5M9K6V4_MONFR|nr:hypothetical protein EYC84_006417 [Monilinia fructicola]